MSWTEAAAVPCVPGANAGARTHGRLHQFLDLSTILPAVIQGIIARSFSPTSSI